MIYLQEYICEHFTYTSTFVNTLLTWVHLLMLYLQGYISEFILLTSAHNRFKFYLYERFHKFLYILVALLIKVHFYNCTYMSSFLNSLLQSRNSSSSSAAPMICISWFPVSAISSLHGYFVWNNEWTWETPHSNF